MRLPIIHFSQRGCIDIDIHSFLTNFKYNFSRFVPVFRQSLAVDCLDSVSNQFIIGRNQAHIRLGSYRRAQSGVYSVFTCNNFTCILIFIHNLIVAVADFVIFDCNDIVTVFNFIIDKLSLWSVTIKRYSGYSNGSSRTSHNNRLLFIGNQLGFCSIIVYANVFDSYSHNIISIPFRINVSILLNRHGSGIRLGASFINIPARKRVILFVCRSFELAISCAALYNILLIFSSIVVVNRDINVFCFPLGIQNQITVGHGRIFINLVFKHRIQIPTCKSQIRFGCLRNISCDTSYLIERCGVFNISDCFYILVITVEINLVFLQCGSDVNIIFINFRTIFNVVFLITPIRR